MPYCPKCRTEYREGVTRCSDCNELLVTHLSDPEPQYNSEPMELVEIFSGITTTSLILQEMLNERGIESILRPIEPLAGVLGDRAVPPYSAVMISSYDEASHRADVEECLSLISEVPEEAGESQEDQEEDGDNTSV